MVPRPRWNQIQDYLESRDSDIQIAIENISVENKSAILFSLYVFDENYKNDIAPFDLMEFFHKTFSKKFNNMPITLATSYFETFVYLSEFTETPDDSLVEKFASFLKNSLDDYIKLR